MAIIQCPSCNKPISDKAKQCRYCNALISSASADDIYRQKKLRKYNQVQSIQTQSMVAMLMFVGGFGFMFWGDVQPSDIKHTAAMVCTVIGFVWYIVNRVRMIVIKKGS